MSVIIRKILVATANPGKFAEISAMLDADVQWLSLKDFPDIPEVKEDGATFAENARKKALGYAKQTGLWTLADDSGLVIDALGGAPGVKSARFSGEKEANRKLLDHKNMAKVLKLLTNIPREKRTARFVCCLCLASPPDESAIKTVGKRRTSPPDQWRASPERILIQTEGKLEGLINDKEIGENGFGYDPIFFLPHLNKTVAQLTREEKNAISHRGNAIKKLKPLLTKLMS